MHTATLPIPIPCAPAGVHIRRTAVGVQLDLHPDDQEPMFLPAQLTLWGTTLLLVQTLIAFIASELFGTPTVALLLPIATALTVAAAVTLHALQSATTEHIEITDTHLIHTYNLWPFRRTRRIAIPQIGRFEARVDPRDVHSNALTVAANHGYVTRAHLAATLNRELDRSQGIQ